MSFSDSERILKGIAFEKAVMEVLKKDNPDLLTEYNYGYSANFIEEKGKFIFDAFIKDKLDLSCFKKDTIYADEIAIEVRAGRISRPTIDSIYNTYREFLVKRSGCFVLITSANKTEKFLEIFKLQVKCKLVIVDLNDLLENPIIKKVLNDFDDYIVEDNNVLIDDFYEEFKSLKSNISFALGAGCSINSNISDWNRLSEALGYELLYNVVDIKDSAYKNMKITKELNSKMFDSYDKNSALDAIYNSYIKSPTVSQLDYYTAIKKVLYMSYDSPNDSNKDLLTSINGCVKRRNVEEIINYNFDSVLEQNYDNKYKSNSKEVLDATTHIGKCTVHHVHGYIPYDYNGKTIVNQFVFTDKDYYDNMMNPNNNCNMIQKRILSLYNVIFVGVSFVDSNMKERLRERKNKLYKNKIFAFLKMPKFDGIGTEIKLLENKYKLIQQEYFSSLGVKILWVKDYNEIPKKIDLL